MRFMAEDCILVENRVCAAGSAILKNFMAPFCATVYNKCISCGMSFEGLVSACEFGIDSLFDGGDSVSPSINAITGDKCDVVLCNDSFGKLRRQAPAHNLIYIQPAYGTVSRFGLIPSISSMDQIGILCRTLEDGISALCAISGHDARDGTSLPEREYRYNTRGRHIKVGVPTDFETKISGIRASDFEAKYFDLLSQVFYVLGCAEISNNTNRYDGVKFGLRPENATGINDLYVKTRTSGFEFDTKLAILVGYMVLSREHYNTVYHKAMQLRAIVRGYYGALLSELDAIAFPARLNDTDKFRQSALYALSGLCGFPSISLPDSMSGLQLITKRGGENSIFALAREVML